MDLSELLESWAVERDTPSFHCVICSFFLVHKVCVSETYEAYSFYTDRYLTSAFCIFHFPEIPCKFAVFQYIHVKDMKKV